MIIPYTNSTYFQLQNPHRTVSTFPGTSNFTVILEEISVDVNKVLDISSDTCSVSDATQEAIKLRGLVGRLIEQRLIWMVDQRNPDTPTTVVPSIWDDNNIGIRHELLDLKRDEHLGVYTYRMSDGRLTKH